MEIARSFRELNTYRLGPEAAKAVFDVSKTFPKEEKFALTDQIRRSSRAVNAMIAEAWAKRRYRASFINKIDDTLGEANETQSWLDHALDCGYITPAQFSTLDSQWQAIGGKLSRMIDRADDFSKNAPDTDYRTHKAAADAR
jgi:four helix bundle protein